MKVLLPLLLLVVQSGLPLYIQPQDEAFQPKPFQYEYGLAGDRLPSFNKKEKQDSAGNVVGEYSVVLPDGRVMVVTYNADHYEGFVSTVNYQGEAAYPKPGKTETGYQNKILASNQPSIPALKYREIQLPKLVTNNVNPSKFLGQSKRKDPEPAYIPAPIYKPKKKKKTTSPVYPKRKKVHLPTFFRPERKNFKPITRNGSQRGGPTNNPTEVANNGNKRKRFIPMMMARSSKVEVLENIPEIVENVEQDSESKIEESKMFEFMKDIKKLM